MPMYTTQTPDSRTAALLRASVPAETWQLATPQPMQQIGSMSPYRPTRREFLIGAGSLLVLAPYGCGGESGQEGETTASGTRTVEHVLGVSEVPVSPQRIAVITRVDFEYAAALDAPLVAAPNPVSLEPQTYLRRRREKMDLVGIGSGNEPNIESIATAEPDLIVSRSLYIEDTYDELSQIAPTVGLDHTQSWKKQFDFFARVVGRRERGEELLSAYEGRVQELRSALGGRTERTSVSVVRGRSDTTNIRLYLSDAFSGSILEDLGFSRPPSQDKEGISEDISFERVELADADAIFLWSFSPEEEEALAAIREKPLWNSLDAVRSGRVYEVGSHWYGNGPPSANRVLDDIEKYLIRDGSTS